MIARFARLLCKLDMHLTETVYVAEGLDKVLVACVRPECGAQWEYDSILNRSRRVV